MQVKVSGTWRNVAQTKVKVGGAWKATQSGWVRLSGVWREFVANTLSLGYNNTAFTVGSSSQTKSPTVTGGLTSESKLFALVSGALPEGVTFNASNGVLTGPASWTFAAQQPTLGAIAAVQGIVATRTSGVLDGGAIVTGVFSGGPIIFGSTTLTLRGNQTAFVAKISSTGSWLWAASNNGYGKIANTGSIAIAATDDGGAIISSYFQVAPVSFGSTTLAVAGSATLFAAKISSTGSWSWAVANTGTGSIGVTPSIAATSDGGAVITSYFYTAAITFGSTTLALSTASGTTLVAKVSNTGSWSWAAANTGTGVASGSPKIVATSDGGAIVSNYFRTASITLGATTLALAGINTAFVAKVSNTGSWSWAAANTGTGSVYTIGPSIVGTSDGGAIIAGLFQTAAVTFGSSSLGLTGTRNIFVAKVSNTGSWSWASTNTGTGSMNFSNPNMVATSDGGAIVTNTFQAAAITFGSTTLALAGGITVFVAKVSSTGSWSWAAANTGTGTFYTSVPSISVTSDNGAVIGAAFQTAAVTFGSTTVALAAGGLTFCIAKISSTGSWSSALAHSGSGNSAATPVVATTSNDDAISASIFGTSTITLGSNTLSNYGSSTSFCVKVSSAGSVSWASQNTSLVPGLSASTTSTQISSMAATSDGGAIVTGYFSAPIAFGSTVLAASSGAFVAKLSGGGEWLWANCSTGTGGFISFSPKVAATSDGGAIITGLFSSQVTFGSTTLASTSTRNLFVAKISNTGSWTWANQNTGLGTLSSTVLGTPSIAVTSDGGAIVTSYFSGGSVTFGSTSLTISGTNTLLVAKISSAGSWSWAVKNTGTGSVSTQSPSLVVTNDDGAIVTGTFGTASITLGSTALALAGSWTLYAAKVSSTGSWLWASSNTGTGAFTSTAPAIVATRTGGIFDGGAIIASYFGTAAVTFGSTTLAGTGNFCVAKVSDTGVWSWAATNTGAGNSANQPTLAPTNDGGGIVTSLFGSNSITLGSTTLALAGPRTLFVAKISSSGSWSWAAANTGTGALNISTVQQTVSTSDGGAIVTGLFTTANIAFGSYTALYTGGLTLFAAKISSTGAWSWVATNTSPTGIGIYNGTPTTVSTSLDGAIITGLFSSEVIAFGSTYVPVIGTNTPFYANVSSTGAWGTIKGFPATVTISATDSSGTVSTTPTLTAV